MAKNWMVGEAAEILRKGEVTSTDTRDLMKRFVLKLRTVFKNWSHGTIAKRVDNSLCMWSYPILVFRDERGIVTRIPVLKRRTLYNYIDRDGNLIRIKGR